MPILLIYAVIFVLAYAGYELFHNKRSATGGLVARKTVTFGDESAVRTNRVASLLSIITIFFIWGAFTGSKWTFVHVPGPFIGDTTFTYTAENAAGVQDDGTVHVRVAPPGETAEKPNISMIEQLGFVRDDAIIAEARRSKLLRVHKNDDGGIEQDYRIIAINGQAVKAGQSVIVDHGTVTLTSRGGLSFMPKTGWQMEPIWLPGPEAVVERFIEIFHGGYQNVAMIENIGWSLFRVVAGFVLGSLIGIPLGYAMGLNGWVRGWFDPIVEFMRPIPPLALIPLVIIWFGIWEQGKISLLFLAALWIMAIAARAGVSGVNISKVHAAYSLGASKAQILIHVVIPNSLPEIFTGARVAMGVCWGTVVASELVAAEKGVGKMIIAASKFQQTDIVIMGIILIGIIGYGIDVLMRLSERILVPWKGKS